MERTYYVFEPDKIKDLHSSIQLTRAMLQLYTWEMLIVCIDNVLLETRHYASKLFTCQHRVWYAQWVKPRNKQLFDANSESWSADKLKQNKNSRIKSNDTYSEGKMMHSMTIVAFLQWFSNTLGLHDQDTLTRIWYAAKEPPTSFPGFFSLRKREGK